LSALIIVFCSVQNAYAPNQEHNSQASASNNFGGLIWLEKFTGIPNNQTKYLTLFTTDNGTGSFLQGVGSTASHSTGFSGNVWVDKFTIPGGANVTTVSIGTFLASGNIRIKVYDGNGASLGPGTELEDVASQAVSVSGDYVLPTPVKVRGSNIIWLGFELQAPFADLYYVHTVADGSTAFSNAHVYGTGPNPFGTINLSAD